ncbi:alpha/beta fold hydrolase [Rothia sp. LK2588]|uniref:alpha/beta fold hydrolase n=1 Tax=Rothia sp. LK2588 TaxID=3114369 RepID=UPI0034CE3904
MIEQPSAPQPAQWPGVDPAWSHTISVTSTSAVDAGTTRRWHYLDNGPALEQAGRTPVGTILAVHGNPTWSYLWRSVVAGGLTAENPWRVIAVDQLDMGYSERTGGNRRLADRVNDLGDFTAACGLDGTDRPVVTLAHDWGGLISLGWALEHRNLVRAVTLTNTAVYHDETKKIPAALQLALNPAIHGWGTEKSTAFLDVTLHLAQHGGLDKEVYRTYAAPYSTPALRAGIRQFVADIPAGHEAPSYSTMLQIAEGIRELAVPAFFQWGTKDPVFQRRYMKDLQVRLPQADVHRYEKASHLVMDDEDIATPLFDWLNEHFVQGRTSREAHLEARAQWLETKVFHPMISGLTNRADDNSLAVVDMSTKDETAVAAQLTWAELNTEVNRLANGLYAQGVRPGSRVNLMVPPGSRLTALLYACLKIGAVIVVADTGLGAKGLTRALKGARPDFLVGISSALVAARTLGWPGKRIAADSLLAPATRALGAVASLRDFTDRTEFTAHTPAPDDDAAVLYTSGSTGPAKGVVYTQRQLAGMRDAIQNTYELASGSGLVAGFAPFALLGPALGATSVTPKMDVTKPKTLTASALAAAAAAIDANTVFVSPAAMMNIVATSGDLTTAQRKALERVTTVLSAGAPLPVQLLQAVQTLVPRASIHTPYGMTEALPITDVSFEQIRQAVADGQGDAPMLGAGSGVCVGTAVYGAEVRIAALDEAGQPSSQTTSEPGVTGEIVVAAPHVKDRYDTLWVTERVSTSTPGWHHTGDVGHFDAAGRLWVEGRLAHVMVTGQGVLTPVAAEQSTEKVSAVRRAAVVGVGPESCTTPVAVVETDPLAARAGRASAELTQAVRAQVLQETGIDLAAVLVVREHPTDVRHNSKIDREKLSRWATAMLSGHKAKMEKA